MKKKKKKIRFLNRFQVNCVFFNNKNKILLCKFYKHSDFNDRIYICTATITNATTRTIKKKSFKKE